MATSYNSNIITDGLVLCLDAGDRKSYSGSGSTWTDRSGNGNDGTLSSPTFSDANGGVLAFDGTDDVVNTSYGPALTDFTIMAWFKSVGTSKNYNRIVDKLYTTGIWIGRQASHSNKWGGGCLESSNPYGRYITLTDGEWHMIVSHRQGTTHTIYGDGVSNYASGTVSSAALSTVNFAFGNWYNGNNSQRLEGNIASVRIYDRALTEDEILQNFNAQRGRFGI